MSGTVQGGQPLDSALLGVPAWTAMTLTGGWSNYGSGFTPAEYRKWELTNEVEVIGVIAGGTVTSGTVIFTLPAGYIPVSQANNPVVANGTNPFFLVNASGQISVQNISSGPVSFHFWISLDA